MRKQAPDQLDTDKKARRTREKRVVNHIVWWIVGIGLALLLIVGFMGYRYVHQALQPVNPRAKSAVAVKIPIGSTTKDIGAKLEQRGVIRSATVFNYYVKFHNYANFQAGTYTFTKAEDIEEIISILRGGAADGQTAGSVLIKEGVDIATIADAVDKLKDKNSAFTKANFLKLMKDEAFFNQLVKQYPKLLTSAKAAKDVRYRLEGYLYPATYTVNPGADLKTLVENMVAKTDSVLQDYYPSIEKQKFTVQEVLTLASLVEREGVTKTDRRKIAGVFLNRLQQGMPIQSDISVMYALNTHKTHLTNKDTSVQSPYNLYKNPGYGPGPFNSPSLAAIEAVLSPQDRDSGYLYFVANLKTGEILYATTLDQHDLNIEKFAADNATK